MNRSTPGKQKPVRTIPAAMPPKRKKPPFPFVLDALAPLDPQVRPMFSGHAVYLGDKVVLMLRDRPKSPQDNGVWLVFGESFDLEGDLPRLRNEFPSLRTIDLLHGKIKHWLILPADSPTFESESLYACERLLQHDRRFGRVPASRRPRRG